MAGDSIAAHRGRGCDGFRLAALRVLLGTALLALVAGLPGPAAAESGTLQAIRARGHLVCGVAEGPLGFSHLDERGVWSGLDIDFCGALAAAVLGKRELVKFRPLTSAERFSALKSGEVDVLARSTTWTLTREAELGVRFVGALFHDGQAVMVRRSRSVTSALELSGATICVASGVPERTLHEFFGQRGMRYTPVVLDKWDDLVKAYTGGRCVALSADVSALALVRMQSLQPAEHQILPEMLSKEPLGPVVAQGDERWFSVVRWVLFALIAAEEYEVTSATADAMRASEIGEVRRLLGREGALGPSLGLSADWAYQAIRQAGNYGEMFERNLGARSQLKLERGKNSPWSKGGALFSPPFR
jgi:general L-amino acid transport system substrate-binding protein